MRSYALLNHEAPEFIRFVNPGDLRIAHLSCGTVGCHPKEVMQSRKSMMTHGCMLWEAAAYNNGSTTTIGNSSAVLYADSGPNGYMVAPDGTVELTAQAFVWSPVNQGQQLFALNLDVLAPGSTVFGQLGSSNGPNPCGDPNNNGVL